MPDAILGWMSEEERATGRGNPQVGELDVLVWTMRPKDVLQRAGSRLGGLADAVPHDAHAAIGVVVPIVAEGGARHACASSLSLAPQAARQPTAVARSARRIGVAERGGALRKVRMISAANSESHEEDEEDEPYEQS